MSQNRSGKDRFGDFVIFDYTFRSAMPNEQTAKLVVEGPKVLLKMTANLVESHIEELTNNHGGDADHEGEAPESCSYCRDIRDARELLRLAGEDVTAITPKPTGTN